METFALRVRTLMREREISLRRLAKTINYDSGYLSRVLNGHRPPSPAMAKLIDTVLDADGTIVALANREIGRRRPLPSGRSRRVDPELIGYFSAQLAGHYVADRQLGAPSLTPIVADQYRLVCDIASEAEEPSHRQMWSLAAAYAAFLGWLYQDSGDLRKSAHWHDVMLERAHRSCDEQLVAFALHNKAMLYVDMCDGASAVDLTEAALVNAPALCAKVRVLALQQAAHGRSLLGGDGALEECNRLLDQADRLIDRIDDPYPWGSACLTPHYLAVQRATCYVRLGADREALSLWDSILPTMPPGARRDEGVFRARQARSLAATGEPEQAMEVAREVALLVEETGSARMRRELQALKATLRPWAEEGLAKNRTR
ncbi:helix-turn-helix transcriptional regulator [Thermopolyspora sp. NPDC052614]|uniref:helix-turn-helix domain-containing protein n=1 Tax=Thermopolyspora sp. NPDC052614 TaxID=3155682 RepID=UPI00341A2766